MGSSSIFQQDRTKAPTTPKPSLLLAPPLRNSSSKASKSIRSTIEYQHLQRLINSKTPLSSYSPTNSDHQLLLRETLNRTLSEDYYFCYLQEGSKKPLGYKESIKFNVMDWNGNSIDAFRPNGADWYGVSSVPSEFNWAAIPKAKSRAYLIDLDVNKNLSFEAAARASLKKIEVLSKILKMELKSTYVELTPSGGLHIFLKLPEDLDPSSLPVAKFPSALASALSLGASDRSSGDIRSGATRGLALMAGSRISSEGNYYVPIASTKYGAGFKDFTMGRKLRLQELKPDAIEFLRGLSANKRTPNISPKFTSSSTMVGMSTKSCSSVNFDNLMEAKGSFHAARAHIYKALSCCSDLNSIATTIRAEGYARDTYRARELSDSELYSDLHSIAKKFGYSNCLHFSKGSRSKIFKDSRETQSMGDSSSRAISLLRSYKGFLYAARKPVAFNLSLVYAAIFEDESSRLSFESQRKVSYRRAAFSLIVRYFGPLFNAGSSNALASRSKLAEVSGFSEHVVGEALRLLRKLKILTLTRRQTTGMVSLYGIGSNRFIDVTLSKFLSLAWVQSSVSFKGRESFLGGFIDWSSVSILRPDGSSFVGYCLKARAVQARRLLKTVGIGDFSSFSIVRDYLRRSLAVYKTTASLAARSMVSKAAMKKVVGKISDSAKSKNVGHNGVEFQTLARFSSFASSSVAGDIDDRPP